MNDANLKLKPQKCKFLKKSCEFLGHTVSENGIECTDEHLSSVANWPEPKDIKELQKFLGFTNFFRRYVAGYSSIVEPMLELMRGVYQKPGKQEKSTRHRGRIKPDPSKWIWGERQRKSFQAIKDALVSPPVLAYPDYSKDFVLHVDASRTGLGAVLYQKADDGKLRVIAYGSKSLGSTERNYSAHKLEFLALKWAVTQQFQHYLYGNSFTVYTDHNPLAYILTTAKLDATGHRWLAELSRYNFQIFYKPGRTNQAADGLSRRPNPEQEQSESTRHVSEEVFKEICKLLTNDGFTSVAEMFAAPPTVISNAVTADVKQVNWHFEQQNDSDTKRVYDLIKKGTRLTFRQRKKEAPGVMKLLTHWDSLFIKDNVLYKQANTPEGCIFRLIVPKHMQAQVLEYAHDKMGHLGREKTQSIARSRFFWIGLTRSMEEKIKTCPRCIRAKTPYQPDCAPLGTIEATRPLEIVSIDFLSLEHSQGGYNSILVMTDVMTKYAWAYPTKNQEAKTVAKILVEDFITHYGIPEQIHSDQGQCFEGKVIQHMCKMLGVKKTHTTIYHPQGNPVERWNRTLLSMLRTLDDLEKQKWKAHVAPLVHAYNCTKHESSGYTPYFLMFGRHPRLAIDVFLGLPDTYQGSVQEVKERLACAYKAANEASKEAAKRRAKYYNKKVKGISLEIGDLVLLKNVGLKGKHKLADKWKSDVYVVIDQPNPDIPVFKVALEKGEGVAKILHRNFLLPLSLPNADLDVTSNPGSSNAITPKPATRKICRRDDSESEVESDVESDFDIDMLVSIAEDLDVLHNVPVSVSEDSVPQMSAEQDAVSDLERSSVHPSESRVSSPAAVSRRSSPVPSPPAVQPDIQAEIPATRAEDSHQDSAPEPRRSVRTKKKPDWYGHNVMVQSVNASDHNQTWQFKVYVLLHLMYLFPLQRNEIMNTLLYLVCHS